MDFHTLLRRDLQFLCKRNKIPANMTNVAMADALKALETVEGLDEYMNDSNSNAPQSPTTVAKQPPKTATRTTRRTATAKAEPKPPSKVVTSSCQLKSKSLAGEMEQESKTNKVTKTPAVRSTRKASAATSCIIKVQESSLQSAYNTRRSTRLLARGMAGLSLETKQTLDTQEKDEGTEQKVSEQENSPAASSENTNEEDEVNPGRDLTASMEKEWEKLKNGSDEDVEDLPDANSGSNNETDGVMADEKESMNSLVQEDKQEASSEANKTLCEEVPEMNSNDQEVTEDVDIPVLDYAITETYNDQNELKDVLALEQADQEKTEEPIQENGSNTEKTNTFDEDTTMDQTGCDASHSETKLEKMDSFDEDAMVDQTDASVDADGTVSEADSNQAVMGSEIAADEEEITVSDSFNVEEAEVEIAPLSPLASKSDAMVDQTGIDASIDAYSTVSEADSNQAVMGSDIADEEMIASLNFEESEVKKTPSSSPLASESIAVQFPRPNKSTTPSKNSALKVVNVEKKDKENSMEMIMMMNGDQGEAKKKKKKVVIDEERLKDASMRQLHKMFKELTIKSSSNRTALQILPGNHQKAE